jgi:hypothetical protein
LLSTSITVSILRLNFLTKIYHTTCTVISLFIFFYIFYRSEIVWSGERHDDYFIYYLISIALIIYSIFFIYFKPIIKSYLMIFSISVVVSLYLFESYLYFVLDEKNKYNLYNRLKKTDKNVSVRYSPYKMLQNYTLEFPLSGKSFSKTIDCNESGYFSINEHDRYGFNNPDSQWDAQQLEYFIIGDSFAYGSCVNRPNDIASQLRILSKKSVISVGYPANGPLMEYASLREYFSPNIKKVLWIYYEGNDLHGINKEINNKVLKKYIDNPDFSQNLKLNQKKVDEFTLKANEWSSQRYLVKNKIIRYTTLVLARQVIKSTFKKVAYKPELEDIKNYENLKKIIQLASNFCNQNNSKLFFVYLSNYYRYTTDYDDTERKTVEKIIKEIEIPFIDIHSVRVLTDNSSHYKLNYQSVNHTPTSKI